MTVAPRDGPQSHALPSKSNPKACCRMRTYLDFEKPIAELESKVTELKALSEGDASVSITEEIARLQAKAQQSLRSVQGGEGAADLARLWLIQGGRTS